MIKQIYWWFTQRLFRFLKWANGIEHACYFLEDDVRNLKIDPRCVHCGKKLSEATGSKAADELPKK